MRIKLTDNQLLDLAYNKEVVDVAAVATTGHISTSSQLINLTKKSPDQWRKSKGRLVKGLSTGESTGTTEEENNHFLDAKGELVLTPIFEYDENRRVLQTYKGLYSHMQQIVL